MTHSITLDWLAFTFLEDSTDAQGFLHSFASSRGAVEITATNGYRTAYRTRQGVLVQWNVDRPEMGYHVIISGSAIRDVLEYYQLDQKTLVGRVRDAGASITRLDLARDITNQQISLDKIYQALERGEYSGTSRKFAQIHSLNGGNTIYVGSRQSEKFIRIYDKASESNLPHSLWFRFELELKGMVARACASVLATSDNWGAAFTEIVQHMVSMGSSVDFAKFFPNGEERIGIPKLEKKTDRERWIETQVIPAVVKHFIEARDSKAIALLRAMLDQIEASTGKVDNQG